MMHPALLGTQTVSCKLQQLKRYLRFGISF
jgi:hypothetical protein